MINHENTSKTHKVDVSKIYNGTTDEIKLDFSLDVEEGTTGDYTFKEPVRVVSRVYEKARGRERNESYVELEIGLYAKYDCVCARCAKELTKELCVNESFGVTKRLNDDSDDYVEAPEGFLDVAEVARTLFYLELPQRVLCKDDCRGLCPVCGVDLNVSECSCKTEKRGNRLEALKKLLDNYEEK